MDNKESVNGCTKGAIETTFTLKEQQKAKQSVTNEHTIIYHKPKLLGQHSALARSLLSVVESYQSYEDLPKLENIPTTDGDTDEVETPSEGKEALLVLACSTLLAMIVETSWIAFPLFYVEFSEHFNESKFLTGGIGSTQNALCQTLQLVSSGLIQAYGCKPVAISGALVVFASFLLSTFATSIGYLYVTYGVIGGMQVILVFLILRIGVLNLNGKLVFVW